MFLCLLLFFSLWSFCSATVVLMNSLITQYIIHSSIIHPLSFSLSHSLSPPLSLSLSPSLPLSLPLPLSPLPPRHGSLITGWAFDVAVLYHGLIRGCASDSDTKTQVHTEHTDTSASPPPSAVCPRLHSYQNNRQKNGDKALVPKPQVPHQCGVGGRNTANRNLERLSC